MKFNPKHKVIIDSLDMSEAKAFVKFLESEIIRHQDDIIQATALIYTVQKKFALAEWQKEVSHEQGNNHQGVREHGSHSRY